MDKGKKIYTLRGKTFNIEANDRLMFMRDARDLYNQVAEDCFGRPGWIPFTGMDKLLDDAERFGRDNG